MVLLSSGLSLVVDFWKVHKGLVTSVSQLFWRLWFHSLLACM
jgi:hypothetical protein